MKTILCVTDSSAGSENSISYILGLVRLEDARIILFHNIQPATASVGGSSPSHAQLIAELEERNEYMHLLEGLRSRLESVRHNARITYELQIRHGFAKDTIPALAQRKQADLIVLCNEADNELTGKSNKTLATEIRGRVNCPVLFVPQPVFTSFEKTTELVTAL